MASRAAVVCAFGYSLKSYENRLLGDVQRCSFSVRTTFNGLLDKYIPTNNLDPTLRFLVAFLEVAMHTSREVHYGS